MSENIINQDEICEETAQTTAEITQDLPETNPTKDLALLEQAHRRIQEKYRLWWQLFDFLLIVVALIWMVNSRWVADRQSIAVIFGLFFGIRLLIRTIKFAKPNFSGGFKNYVQLKRENALEAEYNRLKKIHNINS